METNKKTNFLQQCKAVMIGHAVGDAFGVPIEFVSRELLSEQNITDMIGYGSHPVPKGCWSDDTSMALCALDVLTTGKINFDLVMENFADWLKNAAWTATDTTFDVGNTCYCAIYNYANKRMPWSECGINDASANGNGSLMRIHPFTLWTYKLDVDIKEKIKIIEDASSLTHAHERSKIACGIYSFVLWELLSNPSKSSIKVGLIKAYNYYKDYQEIDKYKDMLFCRIGNIFNNGIFPIENEIRSSGYVVDTLEAAVWSLLTTDDYKSCIIKAANLGGDTDTVAAIAGGLASALYGYDNIPLKWRKTLLKRDLIEEMCDKAYAKFD